MGYCRVPRDQPRGDGGVQRAKTFRSGTETGARRFSVLSRGENREGLRALFFPYSVQTGLAKKGATQTKHQSREFLNARRSKDRIDLVDRQRTRLNYSH